MNPLARRFLFATACGLVLAGIAHLAAVLALPWLGDRGAYARVRAATVAQAGLAAGASAGISPNAPPNAPPNVLPNAPPSPSTSAPAGAGTDRALLVQAVGGAEAGAGPDPRPDPPSGPSPAPSSPVPSSPDAPSSAWPPRPDPAVAVGVCAFDLREGPLRLTVRTGPLFESLSLHGRGGTPFYAVTDRAAARGALDLVVLTQRQLDEILAAEDEDEVSRDVRIVAPVREGFAVVRVLAGFASQRAEADEAVRAVGCAMEPSPAEGR